jgi:hypothetical protein
MLDNPKVPLLPEDVVELLKIADAAATLTGDRGGIVPVPAGKLRELVTVWLRVASLLEGMEMNPGQHTEMEHCAVTILLTGECKHGKPDTHDTDPHNEKPEAPEAPTLKCVCGYHGPASVFPGEDSLNPAYHCPGCGEDIDTQLDRVIQ